ncbi:uncharacterized protein LOC142324067 isoform X2 [Lycorma delicatula]
MLMHGWCISYFDNTTNYCTDYDRIYLWRQMAGQELRRSYTQVELLPRDRHFNLRVPLPQTQIVLQQQQGHAQVRDRRRYSAMPTNKVKHATMEIYRPPNVRVEGSNTSNSPPKTNASPRLNVHAKEFTMSRDLPTSRSSSSIATVMSNNNNGFMFPTINGKGYTLQHSKSSGNVLHSLQQSKSSGNVLHALHNANQNHGLSPRVHFRLDGSGNSIDSQSPAVTKISPPRTGLKRSKSLSATDTLRGASTNSTSNNSNVIDLGEFPSEMHVIINKALQDPNKLSARTLMQLVKLVMERAADSRRYAEPAAKLCINIIEKEKKETFLESLLNMCQLWYQERDKVLKSKYPPFMGFLNEMYCQLKRSQLQLKTHYDGVPPPLLLLTLLSKCCQDCLKPPAIQSLSETECLFFVLTSIGRDLEQEMPKELEQVLASVRDAFLTAVTTPAIRKTLLQLIELHAAKWQLPASAVMYYYPGTSR